jgi:SM-20-related protein
MSQVRPVLRSRTAADRAALAARLASTGRVQIPDLLDDASAAMLLDEARLRTPFQTVTLGGKGHVDLPAAWLEGLTPAQRTDMGRAAQEAATERFHYLYDNHPLWDLDEAGRLDGVWKAWLAFANSEAFLGPMREITGEPRIAFADAQVTRYRRGHFLTAHDDGIEGKNRYFAYVLNLSPRWKIEWGGLLMFHGDDGHVAEAFLPNFNSLNLLKVPALHSVSQVSLFAGDDRLAVTGWLRGR